ncbi:S-layer homology domain-containing protein [Ruminiclostridium cellulolyticum]|uniref:S-layer domain protein n=1 Tax=Ruminiclostridium cellulolyticum (strain ATCC 35319 / DSM 5812 / JCM 6584 / H10) TaxID=394503 RepID=B8I5G1_RUMCH|nr:S-layer homology domain-containing protein [Ruminiclostridium cellulolyticum]ACL76697.1 S-layer domain protein [Ruminiclostridium cellulolyticum H10]
MKKTISIIVAVIMLMSSFGTSFAAADTTMETVQQTFKDLNGHWASDAIYKWSTQGVINGYDGLFRPNDSITRGEMACILDNIMDYQSASKNTFSDLKPGQFYTNAVLKANAAGIINGNGATLLRPTDKITREEAVVMMAKAFAVNEGTISKTQFSDEKEVSSWARTSVFGMEAKGYVNGNKGKFNPKANITRAEIVAIINNIVKGYYTKAGTYDDNVTGTVIIKVPDVTLKGVNITENLIIAEGVGEGDVTLDSVTVKGNTVVRGGGENSIHITGSSNISNIKIEKNNNKLRIVILDGNTVKEIEIAKGEEIIVTGSVGTLEIATPDVIVKVIAANISDTKVVSANASIFVDKESKIKSVSINNSAENTAIKAEKGAVVNTVFSEAETNVSGEGTVEQVLLKEGANNSSVTTPNTHITAAAGVTGATAGGVPVTGGTSVVNNSTGNGTPVVTPTPNPGNGGNSGGDNTTPPVTPVSDIRILSKPMTLTAGGTTGMIIAMISPSNATNKKVIWSSSDTKVATVKNGIVTPLTEGTTVISVVSAADPTKTATTTVTVSPADTTPPVTPVSDIRILTTPITLTAGGPTGMIIAIISPSNATNKKVTWSSSDTKVATVNNGIVTPLTEGTTIISAVSAADPTKTATTTVTVGPADTTPPELSDGTVENLGSAAGTTATLKYHATKETGRVTYYCLLQDASAGIPTVAEIKTSNIKAAFSGNPVYYTINLTGLTAGQKYTAYIVMEDVSDNTSNILTITGINPYSNAALEKLNTPSLTLSSNTSGIGGLAYTITTANGAEDSNVKEYLIEVTPFSALGTPTDKILTLTIPKNSVKGILLLNNIIVAGNSYVARIQAIVTDGNKAYQNSDISDYTDIAVAQAVTPTEPGMQVEYVSNLNKDSAVKNIQFSYSGYNGALASDLTIDTTKISVMIGSEKHQLSKYRKAEKPNEPGTYELLYGTYVKINLTDADYNAIIGDANFTSPTGTNKLVADLGWASINGTVSGKASESTIKFSRNLTIVNNSDEYVAKYQLPQNYHYKLRSDKIQDLGYSVSSITFYSELVTDSSTEPNKGYQITKTITPADSNISFSEDDVWARLSAAETPTDFAPTGDYYKVSSADTDRVEIVNANDEKTYYKVAQGVAGRINSMLTNGETVNYTDSLMFKFGDNGTLEAIKVVGDVSIGIDLVGHFAPSGVPVYLDSDTAKLTISGGNTIGDIIVTKALKDSYAIYVTGGKVGNITLADGVKLNIQGSEGMTEVGNINGTDTYTVAIDVNSQNKRKVLVGDIELGNSGMLDLYQNDAGDLSEEYFTIGNVTAITGASIKIPNSSNVYCNPYGWFMKFEDLADTVTFMIGNQVYTPPTEQVAFSVSDSSLAYYYGVINYYDSKTWTWRFFFTDAQISEADLEDDSKVFTFSAVNAEHISSLVE